MLKEEKPITAEAPKPETNTELDTLRQELARIKEERDSLLEKGQSLNEKVKSQYDERSKKETETKILESALMFNMSTNDFLKNNESILPKEIGDILRLAERETYGSSVEKANVTKAAIIQSFFSQQSNLDLLTDTQKNNLAEYLKLTKNGKEEKAKDVYENLFEPALGSLKRVKKAEELNKAKQGFGNNTDSEQAYKDKLTKMAEKKFFRGKN